jgi:hypothetical protein
LINLLATFLPVSGHPTQLLTAAIRLGVLPCRTVLQQGDVMTSLLLVTALAIVAFTQPHRLAEHSPATLAIGLGAVLPLCFSWGTSTATYLRK